MDENERKIQNLRKEHAEEVGAILPGINAEPETPSKTAEIVVNRAMKHFKRIPKTIYRLMIVPNPYTRAFNFFFEYARPHHRTRSLPLHTLYNYDLANLEKVVIEIRKINGLPIHFRNFPHNERWPKSGRLIRSI